MNSFQRCVIATLAVILLLSPERDASAQTSTIRGSLPTGFVL